MLNGIGRPAHGDVSEVTYLSAEQLYSTLVAILKQEKVARPASSSTATAGGARTYPVTLLDRNKSRPIFWVDSRRQGGRGSGAREHPDDRVSRRDDFVLYCSSQP